MIIALLLYLLIIGAVILVSLGIYFASMFPFFRMAKNQGIDNAWLAFIPIGNIYIMLKLSNREFNIFDKFVYQDRTQAFKLWLIAFGIYLAAMIVGSVINLIPFLGSFIYMLISLAGAVFFYFYNFRLYYDIYVTYGMGENATLWAILGLFIPIISVIMPFTIMNKEPDFEA